MAGQVRTAHVGAALESFRSLLERLPNLTRAELEHAINVEMATKRRPSVLTKLTEAAVKKYRAELLSTTKTQPKE